MFKFGPIRNLDRVIAYLKTVPHGTKRAAIKAIAEYLVGNQRHGFRHDDPYRKTTRAAVYGKQWESDAQRAYVMARIREGIIVLGQRARTPTDASKGYEVKYTQGGYNATITNSQPGAHWTRVWEGWRNWRPAMKVVQDNIKGALRSAVSAVNAELRKKGR
jgi:hypothetical protein